MLKQIFLILAFFYAAMIPAQTPECLPISDLGSEVRVCTGSAVVLNPGNNSGSTFQWSTGATSQTITVTQTGTYWVTITNSCGTLTDSVDVIVDQPIQPNFGGTLGLCPQNSDTLFFSLPDGISYTWSTGHQGQILAVFAPGQYWGQYSNACGTFTESFQVIWSNDPVFDLGPDTTVCSSSGFRLSVPNNLGSVLWNTGSQANSIFVTSTGWYAATVTNNCGTYTDSVYVTMVMTPTTIIDDTVGMCAGSDVSVSAFASMPPNTTVQWSNNTTGNNTLFLTPGQHYAIINGPCIEDTIYFFIEEVSALPLIDLGDTIIGCGDVELDLGNQSATTIIEWYNGSGSEMISINSSTFAWVTLTNACGSVSDSVMVYTIPIPDTSALPDSIYLCPHELGNFFLQYPVMDSTRYLWSNGDTTNFTFLNEVGTVYLTVYNRCDSIILPVFVDTIHPISPFQLPNDTVFCEGEVLILNMEDTLSSDTLFAKYHWFRDGQQISNSADIFINQSGVYKLIKTNICDSIIDEFNVTVLPTPKSVLENRINICSGDTAWLEPDTNGTFFQWSNGHPSLNQAVTQSGVYSITIGNSCDTIVDEVEVQVEHPFPFYSTIDTIAICEGSVLIDAPIPNARYEWSNGTSRSSLRVHASGKYWVRIMNACDTLVDTTTVLITGPPTSILGYIVTVCRGNALVLDAQNFGSTYLWSTGDTTRRITVSDSGRYYVDIENPCGFFRDSIYVFVVDPVELILSNDTFACVGDQLVLEASNPFSTYQWNTGDTTGSITIDATGKYYVTVTNACGSRTDSVSVTFLDVPEFEFDSVFRCESNQSISVYAPSGINYAYQWSTGASTPMVDLTQEGLYWLTIDNGCFTHTDTFVLMEEYPLDVDMGPDTVLCLGENLLLNVQFPGRITARWNTGDVGSSLLVDKPGNYSVRVRNSCGEYYDTIRVWYEDPLSPEPIERILCWGTTYTYDLTFEHHRDVLWDDGDSSLIKEFQKGGVYNYQLTNSCGAFEQTLDLMEENCDCPFYVPNAFTPDEDGVNDLFAYGYECAIIDFTIKIFSRWGDQVFYSTNPLHYWDGTRGGQSLPIGVYNYVISIVYSKYGQRETKYLQGTVTIIR